MEKKSVFPSIITRYSITTSNNMQNNHSIHLIMYQKHMLANGDGVFCAAGSLPQKSSSNLVISNTSLLPGQWLFLYTLHFSPPFTLIGLFYALFELAINPYLGRCEPNRANMTKSLFSKLLKTRCICKQSLFVCLNPYLPLLLWMLFY